MRLTIPAILILGVLGTAGCHTGVENGGSESTDRALLSAMEEEIDRQIGTPTCKDGADCRSVPFGAKPCGGPWKYKIYSVATVDSAKLVEEVAKYNAFNATLNRKYGWISDCSIPSPPVLGCREGRCVDVGGPGK